MKTWVGCVAAMLLCATSARAGKQDWSIGGGIGYGFNVLQSSGAGSLNGFFGSGIGYLSAGTPVPR